MPINKRNTKLISSIRLEKYSQKYSQNPRIQFNLNKSKPYFDNLNRIMKKHNVSISEKVLEKYIKDYFFRPDYYEYLDRLIYMVENRATKNTIRRIYDCFIDKEHVAEVSRLLKEIHAYKKSSLTNVNEVNYNSKITASKYYTEYELIFKNLEQIERETLIKGDQRSQQMDLFSIFFKKEALKNKQIKEEILSKQKRFLELYKELIETIYKSAKEGSIKRNYDRYSVPKDIVYKDGLYKFSIENLYKLKTRAILEDIIFNVGSYENKIKAFELTIRIIKLKRNISVEELSTIGKLLSSFSSSRFSEVLELTNSLFFSHRQKLDKYRFDKAYTKTQKALKEKRSLLNLFRTIFDFVKNTKSSEERYRRLYDFVEIYGKFDKIYDPEVIVKKIK